jgi:hypothetical protein
MRRITTPLISVLLLSIAGAQAPALAANAAPFETIETTTIEETFEDGDDGHSASPELLSYSLDDETSAAPGKRYGPFRVIDDRTIELNGVIDDQSPTQFRRLRAAYPHIQKMVMVECPGSEDDDANLALARMVRAANIQTHVPSHGSIRSGGVELYLAGVKRSYDKGAQFGVHSWKDDTGREARDYAPTHTVHAAYLNYYKEVGFDPEKAKAFYSFTNKTGFDGIHYMTPVELAQFGIAN